MKVRDLLIVAAFVCGVVACSYRAQIRKYFEPAIAPVEYYVNAPKLEQELRAELAKAEELAASRAAYIAVLDEAKDRSNREVASLLWKLDEATAELTALRAYRARFETLCTRIKQLNGDAHAIEQLVSE